MADKDFKADDPEMARLERAWDIILEGELVAEAPAACKGNASNGSAAASVLPTSVIAAAMPVQQRARATARQSMVRSFDSVSSGRHSSDCCERSECTFCCRNAMRVSSIL
jgi:hypothetical protein